MTLDVHAFPCRSDNYGFLIRDEATGTTAAVDTPDADRSARVGNVVNGRGAWWRTVTSRSGDRMKVTGMAAWSQLVGNTVAGKIAEATAQAPATPVPADHDAVTMDVSPETGAEGSVSGPSLP